MMFVSNMMLSVVLDEDDDNSFDEVVLDRICLDELNLMYLQWVQKAMKKGIQHVLNLW